MWSSYNFFSSINPVGYLLKTSNILLVVIFIKKDQKVKGLKCMELHWQWSFFFIFFITSKIARYVTKVARFQYYMSSLTFFRAGKEMSFICDHTTLSQRKKVNHNLLESVILLSRICHMLQACKLKCKNLKMKKKNFIRSAIGVDFTNIL